MSTFPPPNAKLESTHEVAKPAVGKSTFDHPLRFLIGWRLPALLSLCLLGSAILCGTLLNAQQPMPTLSDQPPKRLESSKEKGLDKAEMSVLMRAKLSSTQKIVEGLMSADFSMIHKGAQDLQKICDATQWRSHEDQVYGHYRAELRRTAIKMLDQAQQHNLDGVAYSYMHSMTTCIHCHEYCREVLRVADVQRPAAVISIPVTDSGSHSQRQQSRYR